MNGKLVFIPIFGGLYKCDLKQNDVINVPFSDIKTMCVNPKHCGVCQGTMLTPSLFMLTPQGDCF